MDHEKGDTEKGNDIGMYMTELSSVTTGNTNTKYINQILIFKKLKINCQGINTVAGEETRKCWEMN